MALRLDDYRLLGRSGVRVSPLCLGTMTFGVEPGAWGCTDREAAQLVDLYIDRGGNFIDTANFYGQLGQSEVLLGQAIKGASRQTGDLHQILAHHFSRRSQRLGQSPQKHGALGRG